MKTLLSLLTGILCIITIGSNAQSNCKLLKPGKIVTTNSIHSSQGNQNNVVSIVDTEVENTSNPIEIYSHPNWTSEQIGTITKSVYDEEGNIYVAASSLYNSGSEIGSYRYGDIGGGANDLNAAGTIYKLNAYTGEASIFTNLPQQLDALDPVIFITFSAYRETGPGIADISYNYEYQQIIAANNEDGKLYQYSRNGNLLDTFDPVADDNGAAGFAPLNERITAVSTKANKIYYAIWSNPSSYIASVQIKNSSINKNSAKTEIMLSEINEIANPSLAITSFSLSEGNLIAVTQSEMLNEVTKSSVDIPTTILKKKSNQWQFEAFLNGSTDEIAITNKSSINFVDTNSEIQIWYAGTDVFDNNYIYNTSINSLPGVVATPISDYQQQAIPGLSGKIQSLQIVTDNKFNSSENCDQNSKINNKNVSLSIYPNPNNGNFYIENFSSEQIEYVHVFNVNGTLVKTLEASFSGKNKINATPGLYFVRIKTKTKLETLKLLINKK